MKKLSKIKKSNYDEAYDEYHELEIKEIYDSLCLKVKKVTNIIKDSFNDYINNIFSYNDTTAKIRTYQDANNENFQYCSPVFTQKLDILKPKAINDRVITECHENRRKYSYHESKNNQNCSRLSKSPIRNNNINNTSSRISKSPIRSNNNNNITSNNNNNSISNSNYRESIQHSKSPINKLKTITNNKSTNVKTDSDKFLHTNNHNNHNNNHRNNSNCNNLNNSKQSKLYKSKDNRDTSKSIGLYI